MRQNRVLLSVTLCSQDNACDNDYISDDDDVGDDDKKCEGHGVGNMGAKTDE